MTDPTGPVADFENFTFSNVSAGTAEFAGEFVGGSRTQLLRGISMKNVRVAATKGGWRCSNVNDSTVEVVDTLPALTSPHGCKTDASTVIAQEGTY